MDYEFIVVEREKRITTIRINRPEVMNAMNPYVDKEMDDAFNRFAKDPDQWVAVLTGTGPKAFSAGNDLKWQAENGPTARHAILEGIHTGGGGIHTRFDCFKPIIAAVNGYALGGGFEMAMACDIIIASETASFGLPEPTVGLMAGGGGVHRLPRQIGYHRAMGMILTARRIAAQEAHDLGMVNEVVPPDELIPTANKWAQDILRCAPLSIRASKEAATLGLHMSLEEACGTQFPLSKAMGQSEDVIEGPLAFAEKRPPQWKGR
ncbi:MAG: enoyl-CoA hydratase-related protein [Candidatus Hydrogenedentes bacterium]|jgi:crotonobetainyl-CoA hydratase|nr:enoyl-CoA hydratase-related protein [Candidatus Hydrogenedentota bacterium]